MVALYLMRDENKWLPLQLQTRESGNMVDRTSENGNMTSGVVTEWNGKNSVVTAKNWHAA